MSLTCPDSRLSFLIIQKNQDLRFGESELRHERIDLCRLRHHPFDQGQPFAHSNGDNCSCCFFCRVEEYRREADLAIGSIHGKNQESRHLAWLRYGQHQNVNRSMNAFGPARRASPRPPSPRLHSPRPRPEQLFLPRPPNHCLSIYLPNLAEESHHKGG